MFPPHRQPLRQGCAIGHNNIKYAAAGTADFEPTGSVPDANAGFFSSVGRDPIATIRTLIGVVRPDTIS